MWKLGVCQVDGFLNQTHHFWVEKNSTQLITTQLITRVHIQPMWVEFDFIFITKKKKKKNYNIKIATANSITSVCYPFWVRYQIILFQLSWETT